MAAEVKQISRKIYRTLQNYAISHIMFIQNHARA